MMPGLARMAGSIPTTAKTGAQPRKVATRRAIPTAEVEDGGAEVYDCEADVGVREGGRAMAETEGGGATG